MTVEQFYIWCKEKNILDFKLISDQISINGCFVGYEEVEPDKIDIGYGERTVYV